MDRTKKYIKMSYSKEIQSKWIPQNGDLVWHSNEGAEWQGQSEFPEIFAIVFLTKNDIEYWRNWLWLPRQEDLQKIYMEEYEGGVDMWQAFCDWLFAVKEDDEYGQWNANHYFYSGEQLWFAFVMEKRFHKILDGEKWKIKEGDNG